MLYPQNGDRIVAVDSVTSLHSMYKMCACQKVLQLAVKNQHTVVRWPTVIGDSERVAYWSHIVSAAAEDDTCRLYDEMIQTTELYIVCWSELQLSRRKLSPIAYRFNEKLSI